MAVSLLALGDLEMNRTSERITLQLETHLNFLTMQYKLINNDKREVLTVTPKILVDASVQLGALVFAFRSAWCKSKTTQRIV